MHELGIVYSRITVYIFDFNVGHDLKNCPFEDTFCWNHRIVVVVQFLGDETLIDQWALFDWPDSISPTEKVYQIIVYKTNVFSHLEESYADESLLCSNW